MPSVTESVTFITIKRYLVKIYTCKQHGSYDMIRNNRFNVREKKVRI